MHAAPTYHFSGVLVDAGEVDPAHEAHGGRLVRVLLPAVHPQLVHAHVVHRLQAGRQAQARGEELTGRLSSCLGRCCRRGLAGCLTACGPKMVAFQSVRKMSSGCVRPKDTAGSPAPCSLLSSSSSSLKFRGTATHPPITAAQSSTHSLTHSGLKRRSAQTARRYVPMMTSAPLLLVAGGFGMPPPALPLLRDPHMITTRTTTTRHCCCCWSPSFPPSPAGP